MSLSYEEALSTLCTLFQSWDRETIAAIFESNGYHVERTIEMILSMEQPDTAQSNNNNNINNNQQNNSRRQVENLLDLEEVSLTSNNHPAVNTRPVQSNPSNSNPRKRGIPCVLPDDFLRLPGEKKDSQYLQDEQLAILLQNELFQREVEQALGSDYLTQLYSNNPNLPRQNNRGANPANLAYGSPANVHQPHHHPPTESIPDMGILKSLQTMGEGVKQQLNLLAIQFNNTATAALETIEGKRSRSNSTTERHGSGSAGDQEIRPLTGGDYEEEDEEEVSLIGGSGSSSNNNLVRRQYGKKDK